MSEIILVCSGKGGVGKTTITAKLGESFSKDHSVALLDLDLACPNLPLILGMEAHHVRVDLDNFYPETYKGMQVFSSAFMIPKGVACTWDGATRMRLTKELLEKIKWEPYDYMFVDFLPGCGDELMAAIQLIPDIAGAVIITNTTHECISDVSRLKSMLENQHMNVDILGVVENMSHMKVGNKKVPLFTDGIDLNEALDLDVLGSVIKKKLTLKDFEPIKTKLLDKIHEKRHPDSKPEDVIADE